ncbi:MBL fold metallo-hydrolase [Vibrio metschnikovii]|uniref:MBL fold metallo-hydrolase n=2 Tax=Unclassified Bacteria TaxID=49928 RepID=A0AAU6UMF5_UNCXX|nr:MBL fold metallo-hydrolase [Vibrio metschnikovii]EKO3599602.1 MBL fold metallo-hydrolase [Vibrio metschnikovii]EKO3619708.1 MBL fold metallo-hydrolase [Vibrio metschnikovii]EKO3622989.1 MBL fold metallo-hydrolase [Vibrio metschnikovii]EKO3640151.1 MBL fold metallo-hydrolase [Vibrio metschnikovii]
MKIHTLRGHIQNLYLVEYPDRLMLLDGGCRADVSLILDYITDQLGRSVSELKVVVVTHMHPDHAGGAHLLRCKTGCKIVSGAQVGHWYQGGLGIVMFWADLALAHWMAKRLGKPRRRLWFPRKLRADHQLMDGEAIPGFSEWQVLETTGHTDRDISLFHPQQSILYVADLIVEVKKQLISPFPIFFPKQYRRSVARVYQLNPQRLLLAHGGEAILDDHAYQHLMDTTPITPATHWRVVKIKLKRFLFTPLAHLFPR